MNGVKKCCVCKAFCKKTATVCLGCGQTVHDKCRVKVCCRPCKSCWQKQTRSCVCGTSMRSLGLSNRPLQGQQPDTPPNKIRKTAYSGTASSCTPSRDKENVWHMCECLCAYHSIMPYTHILSTTGWRICPSWASPTRNFNGLFFSSTKPPQWTRRQQMGRLQAAKKVQASETWQRNVVLHGGVQAAWGPWWNYTFSTRRTNQVST